MHDQRFFYDRGRLHSDLARWISDAPTRAKPTGELRSVHDFITRNNRLSQTAECEVTISFSGLFSQRSLQASAGTVGGYLIGVDLVGFEPILRNVLVLGKVGVQVLSNPSSNLAFPKQVTANTFSYLAEGATAPSFCGRNINAAIPVPN